MASVTTVISKVKQPFGGYINPKMMQVTQYDDGLTISNEDNIHASLIGMAVDYLARFITSNSKEDAFSISIKGATLLGERDYGENLLKDIKGLDDKSIDSACKLSGFDCVLRVGRAAYRPVEDINPDQKTIENIRIMVTRSVQFLKSLGPTLVDGVTFEGGYTHIVSSGDADFVTKDCLWDFKVSKTKPTSKHTLQLLIYYLMGKHSIHNIFDKVDKIGIYNPRENIAYQLDIDKIDASIMDDVAKNIIGYDIS